MNALLQSHSLSIFVMTDLTNIIYYKKSSHLVTPIPHCINHQSTPGPGRTRC